MRSSDEVGLLRPGGKDGVAALISLRTLPRLAMHCFPFSSSTFELSEAVVVSVVVVLVALVVLVVVVVQLSKSNFGGFVERGSLQVTLKMGDSSELFGSHCSVLLPNCQKVGISSGHLIGQPTGKGKDLSRLVRFNAAATDPWPVCQRLSLPKNFSHSFVLVFSYLWIPPGVETFVYFPTTLFSSSDDASRIVLISMVIQSQNVASP